MELTKTESGGAPSSMRSPEAWWVILAEIARAQLRPEPTRARTLTVMIGRPPYPKPTPEPVHHE